jgi:hypothetical protein
LGDTVNRVINSNTSESKDAEGISSAVKKMRQTISDVEFKENTKVTLAPMLL